MHRVDRAAGRIGCHRREQSRIGDAEAHLLAFHIAAGLQGGRRLVDVERGKSRIARCLANIDGRDAGDEEKTHDREDRPALALIADHAAEDIGQRRADREDQDHLNQIGQRVRVFEGMRRIGVEEAAAIGAHHLDDFLRGDRALRDDLLGAFQRRHRRIGV